MAPKPPRKQEINPPAGATPKLTAAPTASPAPSATPAKISEDFRTHGETIISEALPRKELLALSTEKLRAYFIKDWRADGDKILGASHFHGNEKFEKWIGLRHLIPAEYTIITVRSPSGETWQGERGTDGSFYDANGKYIAIWEEYTFEASKTAQKAAPPAVIRESVRPTEVPLEQTVFVGDSLTVGMKGSLRGANFVAGGGKQTAWMLTHFRNFLRERIAGQYAGVKRVVIFGGVNDIASGKTPEAIQNNLSAMYSEAKAAGLDVMACTIPQWDTDAFIARYEKHGEKHRHSGAELRARTEAINQWIRSQNGLNDGPSKIAELDHEMDSGRYKRARDGIHLTGKASQAMAQFIAAEGKINLPRAA